MENGTKAKGKIKGVNSVSRDNCIFPPNTAFLEGGRGVMGSGWDGMGLHMFVGSCFSFFSIPS